MAGAHPQGSPGCTVDAIDDDVFTVEDVPVSDNAVANDVVSGCATATASLAAPPADGTVVLNADGTFTYTPNFDFDGIDAFGYTVTGTPSGTGAGDTDTATVRITVFDLCDPVAIDDSYTTAVDKPLASPAPGVLANDEPCFGFATQLTSPAHGSLSFNGDGSFEYTPDAGFVGVDQFDYLIEFPQPTFRRGLGRGPARSASGWRAPRGVADLVATVTITIGSPPVTTTTTLPPTSTTSPPTTTVPGPTPTDPPVPTTVPASTSTVPPLTTTTTTQVSTTEDTLPATR